MHSNQLKNRWDEIAEQAFALRRQIFDRRFELWDGSPPIDEVRMLEPMKAFEILGYEARFVDYLGEEFGIETAGALDTSRRLVEVSLRFSKEEQLFTAAHELGHVVLHPGHLILHRDRPLSGSDVQYDQIEREANWFAVCFLMPPDLVRQRFEEVFGRSPFKLSDDAAFGLATTSMERFLGRCHELRALTRMLAEATTYAGKHFFSLKQIFGVSTTAMAIRLEELGLVAPLPSVPRVPRFLANQASQGVRAR